MPLHTTAIASTGSGVPAKNGTRMVTKAAHATIWPRQNAAAAKTGPGVVRSINDANRESGADQRGDDEGVAQRGHLLQVLGRERRVNACTERHGDGDE